MKLGLAQVAGDARTFGMSDRLIIDVWKLGMRELDMMEAQAIDHAAQEAQERQDMENGSCRNECH